MSSSIPPVAMEGPRLLEGGPGATVPSRAGDRVSRSAVYLTRVGALFIVYYVTARFGLTMGAVSGVATTVWPPTGIALFTLTRFGFRLWPGIALGAFFVNLWAGAPLLAAAGMAGGNTLEALIGAYLLIRLSGFRGSLDRIHCVVGLVFFAAAISTAISATIGVTSGYLGGVIPAASFAKAWWTWWLGDALGNLIMAPVLFAWGVRPRFEMSSERWLEAAALLVSLLTISLLVFGAPIRAVPSRFLQPYVLFPFLIWAALRFRERGTVTITFLIAVLAVLRTAGGTGPFAQGDLTESLLSLQAFMGIVAVTTLFLSAVVSERKRAEAGLLQAHEELEARIAERTAQLSSSNRALQEEILERKQAEDSLRQLSTRLLKVQDEERQRLARELHDSTAQNLAALSMNLAVVTRRRTALDERGRAAIDEGVALAERCSREIRSISYLLHPPLLEEVGLPGALRWLAEGFARRSGILIDFDVPAEFGRLPMELENTLFRIVQECLTNVHRHSGSPTAQIRLARKGGDAFLEVRDQGRGMPSPILSKRGGIESLGVGLLGMRERVRQLGGRLEMRSHEGGTAIRVEIPIPTEGR